MDSTSSFKWGHFSPKHTLWLHNLLINMGLARGWLRKKIIQSWMNRSGEHVDIERGGIKYRLKLGDNITDLRILTSHHTYDQQEIGYLKKAMTKGVFVDVGANTGFYSLTIGKLGFKVIAIEVNPITIQRLRFNRDLNDFASNISIITDGVGLDGTFTLHSTGDLGSASLHPNAPKSPESITVKTRPLLSILEEEGVKQVDGLKIDVEGMEDRVLLPFFKEAPRSLWPACIVIEHCTQDEWEVDVIEHMQNIGYSLGAKTRANSILQINRASD